MICRPSGRPHANIVSGFAPFAQTSRLFPRKEPVLGAQAHRVGRCLELVRASLQVNVRIKPIEYVENLFAPILMNEIDRARSLQLGVPRV